MASNSTSLIADVAAVLAAGPAAGSATKASAISQAGPIMDYAGCLSLVQLKLSEAAKLTKNSYGASLYGVTDAGDTANKAYLLAVYNALAGVASSPSAALITAMTSVAGTAPGATTKANCISQAGPIMDYVANCNLVLGKLKEAYVLITLLLSVTDSSIDSTNYGKLLGVQQVLV
jgi:hypothetical protein